MFIINIMESIVEKIRMGGGIFEGLEKINAYKRLKIEKLNEIYNAGINFPFLDLDNSQQYLLTGQLGRIGIFKQEGDGLSFVGSLGSGDTRHASWLPLDAGVCFSAETSNCTMWDSNIRKAVFKYECQGVRRVVPHLRSQTYVLFSGENCSKLIDYMTGDTVHCFPYAFDVIKWSPARDEFFVTGTEKKCLLWDVRRLRSPVFAIGFNEHKGPYKRTKVGQSFNVYEEFFISHEKDKTLEAKILDLKFSEDGRKVLIKCSKGIYRTDLLQTQEDPDLVVKEESKEGFVEDSDLGILSGVNNGICRYNQNGELTQKLNFQRSLIEIIQIKDLSLFYVLDSKCNVHRISTE